MDTVSAIRGKLGRPALDPAKRTMFMSKTITVASGGKIFPSGDPLKFSFSLEPTNGVKTLPDSYVGVDFSIVYKVSVVMNQAVASKPPIKGAAEFNCKVPGQGIDPAVGKKRVPQDFTVTPDEIDAGKKDVPKFHFSGQIASVNCCYDEPFDGYLICQTSEIQIKSIEIQLVRVESFEGKTSATEVQNIQIADGNVIPDLEIPMYMLFPKIFCCSSFQHENFSIDFHVNLIVIFHNGYQLTENIPIRIYR